ncbi:MAG: lysozyme inhibitor LprI family protein [Smithella sp.]
MEVKVHVPVDRQTCHVIPGTNRAARLILGGIIIIALFGLLSTQANAASFDCKKASTWLEKTVCSNPELSKLDEQMAKAYHDALASLSPEGQKETKQYQKQWLKNLFPFCNDRVKFEFDGSTVKCLKDDYEERIAALQRSLIKFPNRSFRNVYVDASEIDKTCEDNAYVNIGFMYPQIENPLDENEKFWNKLISQNLNNDIKNHKKGEGYCADISIFYSVGFSNRHLISYQDDYSQYDHGASHEQSVTHFFNWLLEGRRELQITDLFNNNTKWRYKLAALFAQKKKKQEAADESKYKVPGEDFKSGLIDIDKLTSSDNWWMISKDGLVLRLDAWNDSHSVIFTIDWKTLDPYLSKNGKLLISD